ncbi:MAG: hypothetical protein MJ252_26050 [archaeon]|nr:hypothetical protein [archaeon]
MDNSELNDQSNDQQEEAEIKNNKEDNEEMEEDILSKLEEEGNKIGDIVDNAQLNIISKYGNCSEDELKQILEEKNESLLKLHKEKEESKTKLNEIIKNLNDLIAKNEELLYKGEEDEQSIEQLERILKIRTKDLEIAKSTNISYQKHFKAIQKKEKEKAANEKSNAVEAKIDKIRKENLKYKNDINELKKEYTTQSKKLEFSSNKKTQDNIKSYTNEIKSLSNKKHEYHLKLMMNQKSLDSIKKELTNLENMSNAYIKEESDATQASKIIEWIDMIKNDLSGSNEEIWERVDSGNSKVVQAVNEERQKVKESQQKEKLRLPKIEQNYSNEIRANSSSGSKKYKYSSNQPLAIKVPVQSKKIPEINLIKSARISGAGERKDGFKGIFTKYTYLQKNIANLNSSLKKSMSKNKEQNKEQIIELTSEECLKNDYDNTNDADYKLLLDKIKEYEKTNERLEKNIKDYEKMSERKLKDISNTILFNSQKLLELQQENDLISSEIGNLEKIYELTLEQNKIKKELKLTERKNKKIQPIDQSVTSNEILKQLNGEVNEEDKKKDQIDINAGVVEANQSNIGIAIDESHAKNIKCKIN